MQGPASTWMGDLQGNLRNRRFQAAIIVSVYVSTCLRILGYVSPILSQLPKVPSFRVWFSGVFRCLRFPGFSDVCVFRVFRCLVAVFSDVWFLLPRVFRCLMLLLCFPMFDYASPVFPMFDYASPVFSDVCFPDSFPMFESLHNGSIDHYCLRCLILVQHKHFMGFLSRSQDKASSLAYRAQKRSNRLLVMHQSQQ